MPGTLFVVATPIGNLEDITARALRVLREVALIAAEDTRRTAHLLARYGITTPTTSLREHNEARASPALVARLQRGESIALVSDAGTPTISDPGQRLIRDAFDAGIRVEPIPGPSAMLAALSASGLPSDRFTFLAFPPTRPADRKRWFEIARSTGHTIVFFEAPHRIRSTLEELYRTVGDCPVAVGRELTKAHEQLVKGPISEVLKLALPARGEYTIVADIGQMIDIVRPLTPGADSMWREFCELTENNGLSRRLAISTLAHKYGQSSREIYALVEQAIKWGKR
jgi:16S rRNA (cytidine1402-2'-O)-methyltransferase